MQNTNYTYQIYFSKEHKLYDFTIFKNKKFHIHMHLSNKKDINKITNQTLNNLK